MRAAQSRSRRPIAEPTDASQGGLHLSVGAIVATTGFLRDVLRSLRGWRRTPGSAVLVVLALGLSGGAFLTLVSLVDALIWRDLPVFHPEELVASRRQSAGRRTGRTSVPRRVSSPHSTPPERSSAEWRASKKIDFRLLPSPTASRWPWRG
jgi:hypothetical protein